MEKQRERITGRRGIAMLLCLALVFGMVSVVSPAKAWGTYYVDVGKYVTLSDHPFNNGYFVYSS